MKTVAVLCILAFAAVQLASCQSGLPIFQRAIKQRKQETNAVIRDLTRLKGSGSSNLSNRLSNAKYQQITSLNSAVNSALSDIRTQVNKANQQGKDAEKCYDNASQSLRSISQSGFSNLDRCSKNALSLLEPIDSNIEKVITIARQLLIELDGIFVNCYSSNIMAMERCIAGKMPGANTAVKTLQDTAKNLESTVNSVSNSAYLQASSCMFDAVSSSRNEILNVRFAVNRCVE